VRTWKRAESRGGTRAALLLRASLRFCTVPTRTRIRAVTRKQTYPRLVLQPVGTLMSSHAPFLCSPPPTHAPRTTHTPCALKDASGAEITSQLSPPAAAAAHG
jgi:hypothetical protein